MFNLIFWFLKIGAFSFGGGLATLPNIYIMANDTGWITESEVTDLISLSQMTPGPLACNIATFVGNRVHGVIGAIFAVLAFIIPAIIYMNIFYKCIQKVQNNKEFNFVMSIVRATGFATMIYGSWRVIKTAIFIENSNLLLSNIIQMINYKAVLAAIFIWVIVKNTKISAIKTLAIGGILGIILHV